MGWEGSWGVPTEQQRMGFAKASVAFGLLGCFQQLSEKSREGKEILACLKAGRASGTREGASGITTASPKSVVSLISCHFYPFSKNCYSQNRRQRTVVHSYYKFFCRFLWKPESFSSGKRVLKHSGCLSRSWGTATWGCSSAALRGMSASSQCQVQLRVQLSWPLCAVPGQADIYEMELRFL